MKSEGDCYSIDDLKRDKKTSWSGVRNYQARNFMRDNMQVGDLVLFYHSGGSSIGIYGIAKVCTKSHPDETQFEKDGEYYDPKATRENPRWWCVDVCFIRKFKEPVTLAYIKLDPKLQSMRVVQQGSRLSIQSVSEKHFNYIDKLTS